MKEAEFTVEFTSNSLSSGIHGAPAEYDKFQRDSKNRLVFQKSWFFSAFQKAIEIARIRSIKPGDICMNLSIEAPTEIYSRRYGDRQTRRHEAVMAGTKVRFEAVVADHVTESQLRLILEKLGKYVGLSSFGFNLGYGRYDLLEVKVAPSIETTEVSQDWTPTLGVKQA